MTDPETIERLIATLESEYFATHVEPAAIVGPVATAIATLRSLVQERDAAVKEDASWKEAYRVSGGCMSCALGAPDTCGCTDCLNTGWAYGEPQALLDLRTENDRLNKALENSRIEGRIDALEDIASQHEEDAQEYNRLRDPGMANHQRKYARAYREKAEKLRSKLSASPITADRDQLLTENERLKGELAEAHIQAEKYVTDLAGETAVRMVTERARDAAQQRLAEAGKVIGDLVQSATDEANEKGAGGYHLARLSDARDFLAASDGEKEGQS